ncbi:uncharacterized protein Z518_00202 [Rhinocladiella mackenziei CBS 650.93]|uniref:Major facilitator superfamily (MFS) profile domain-containing protein n=1 Tax=Rhinocladiella mackenziei CBS 650.93 TaxID=1442369 RepID=A0A0D2ISZ1_9EURO|nr:uncharacterized protein Z518_00202 [Rhinocladiella mackenziei CBS 650.93]KIX09124.1 hypothetical protein Z518_00202 [Rhinocladiella mackenziei CBS 650.93]
MDSEGSQIHVQITQPQARREARVFHQVGDEQLDPHIHDDHGDPHRAALEDLDPDAKVSLSVWLAVFFLSFTAHPSISFPLLCVFPINVPIAMDLQGNSLNVNWIAGSWSLAGSVAMVLAGQLSDYFGRRQIVLFGQATLIVGHLLGGTAQSLGQIIAAMTILGLGVGIIFAIYPGISEILPNRYRSLGLATTELQILPISTFGPLIAKALVKYATWRWVFHLGTITAAFALLGTIIFYHPPSKPIRDRSRRQIFRELDHLGLFLYTAGVALFLLGLGWGGIQYQWNSAAVLVPLCLGFLLFCAMLFWDFSGRPQRPTFPLRLFRMFREFVTVIAVMFVTGLVYITSAALIPLQISYIWTADPIKAGFYNIPAGFGAAIGGTLLGGLIYKMKHVPIQMAVAVAIQTTFMALQALITPHHIAMGMVFQTLASLPFGWILIACYVTVGLHVPHRDLGLAYGLVGTSRFLGGAVGSTIFFTILSNKAAVRIPTRVVEAVIPLNYALSEVPSLIAALTSGVTSGLAGIPPRVVEAAANAIKWGYADAFRVTWLATVPFGVIAITLATCIRDPSPYFTSHTAVTLAKERFRDRHHEKDASSEKAGIQGESAHLEG